MLNAVFVAELPDTPVWINLEIFQQLDGIRVAHANTALGEHTHSQGRIEKLRRQENVRVAPLHTCPCSHLSGYVTVMRPSV